MSAAPARPTLLVAALLAAAVLVGLLPAGPVHAAPGAAGPEGGASSLRDQLDAAARGYNDAAARLETSKTRQGQLNEQMRVTESQLAQLNAAVAELAATAYKGGRADSLLALMDSETPDGLLQRATALETRARMEDAQLRRLADAKAAQQRQQAALAAEITVQQAQLAEMDARKKAAEKALAASGGGASTTGPVGTPAVPGQPAGAATTTPAPATGAASATAVPRRADGSLAPESCSVDDPTTSGCLTPRTLHALQQAKAAGFTHFVSCYRPQEDGGEHPRGRACDFAAATGGFGGVATGAERDYGNRLAAWFIANAKALGVLYVIWFKQIWMPSTGWRAYNNGNGDPASDHTNHVHLSVQ
ncbi:coiled-coil domain-containing protein [Planosporangium sp. 12N6]|uniref:coiled-coil domain-containing protein n=1 Tax=Planosporangium spinosum TaxID=3402278 RepID=UPI003CFB1051